MSTYTVMEAAEQAGVAYRTLHNWIDYGLIRPEHDQGPERKKKIVFRDKDIREASILGALRRAGFSLQALRDSLDYLRSIGHNPMSTGEFLVIKGRSGKPADLLKFCTTSEVSDIMQNQEKAVHVSRLWTGS